MNQERGDFEKAIRESFEGFEADVRPEAWNIIQSQLGTGISASTAASGVSKSILGIKGIAAVVSAVIVIGVVTYNLLPDTSKNEILSENVSPDLSSKQEQEEVVEQSESIVSNESKSSTPIVPAKKGVETLSADATKPVDVVEEEPAKTNESINAEQVTASEELVVPNANFTPIPSKRITRGFMGSEPSDAAIKRQKAYAEQQEKELEKEKNASVELLSINASELAGEAPFKVYFSSSSNTEKVNWNTGDNTEEITELSFSHTYEKAGKYKVVAFLEDKFGQKKENTLTIKVEKGSIFGNIPNVITPNGDGKNDVFQLKTDQIQSLSIVISDRSGKRIFSWEGKDGLWDGRDYSGVNVPEGVYFYSIIAKGFDGEVYPEKGSVTLER